jgi:hypothetical protein
MTCFIDGYPYCCPIVVPPVQRIYLNDLTVDGQAETILIQQQMTSEVVLEQVTVHWASPLTTSEFIVFAKTNTVTPAYSTILIQFDPSIPTPTINDWVNNTPFRWRAGDWVYLAYQNTDDIGIGAEIILREV